jgi:prepilin-type N-terminal cleavage/methylation domain-containing protein
MLVNLTIYWFTSESLVMRKVKKQSGFTLVEIAIVLVIIGLLLAGVLKGQELIESSRIKSMAKDLTSFSAMMTSYQDRYRGLPGDDVIDTTHTTRGWGTTALTTDTVATATVGNGLIGAPSVVAFSAPAVNTENLTAIKALRFAGFLEGNGASTTPPANAAGGVIGFTNTVMAFGGVNVVCFTGLNGKQAGALDRLLDDGASSSGSVRSDTTVAAAMSAVTTVYNETTTAVTLCKQL